MNGSGSEIRSSFRFLLYLAFAVVVFFVGLIGRIGFPPVASITNTAPAEFASARSVEDVRRLLEAEVTPERLQAMARSGGDWILRMQVTEGEDRGRFLYQFNPRKEFRPDASFRKDNFLRQAGTTLSLFALHRLLGEERYRSAALRGRNWILHRARREESRFPGAVFFEFRGKVKLGGTALALLTLLSGDSAPYIDTAVAAGEFLLEMQEPSGEFRSIAKYRGSWEDKKTRWRSEIYPGEAMLALVRLYRATGYEKYLAAVERARKFYRPHPEVSHKAKFMPWTTTAMVEAAELTGRTEFRDFGFELADYIIDHEQNLDFHRRFFGSFHHRPSINTAAYLEGLVDAFRAAVSARDESRIEKYRFSILAAFHFISKLQYRKSDGMRFSREAARYLVGGFRSSPRSAAVRIDNTQHAVSAAAKALQTPSLFRRSVSETKNTADTEKARGKKTK
ncbi:MAG: hypothetical protein D6679_12205 [Candidatus Hydrogenedentota bacterium]|nr:MAG: hypothetical protein D6679_12205 [Candidatus Hydrogenedentota bacterium]